MPELEDETKSVTPGSRLVWLSPDGAALLVVAGPDRGASHPIPAKIGGTLSVGKAPDNDFVLQDPTVSRRHLVLERREDGLRVRDAGSMNGIVIGGATLAEARVEPGTLIEIGETQLIVRMAARGAVIPPSDATHFGFARGRSRAMRSVFGLLEKFAPGGSSILLLGETGTGKDVLARSIHAASARAQGPFEVVDCGAIAPALIESELFGHEKGAFTGAVTSHEGAFERAAGGTIFLDEVGELPMALQPKLLRALEAREIRRVGGRRSLPVDVRIVAATTRDLEAEVAAGTFRQDLFFRLAVVPIAIPPLRARLDDIGLLAESLLHAGDAPPALGLAPEALAQLRAHDWPGNVRELRNVLERAAVLAHASGEDVIREVEVLAPNKVAPTALFEFVPGTTYREARLRVEHEFESLFARWLMDQHGGNISAAARAAKMDRKYLGDLLRKHGIKG